MSPSWLKYTAAGFVTLVLLANLVNESFQQTDGHSFSIAQEQQMLASILSFSETLQHMTSMEATVSKNDTTIDRIIGESFKNVSGVVVNSKQQEQQNTTLMEPPVSVATTVVAMISFGNATKQNHAQRCIRSIRTRGQWSGVIVLLTDAPQNYAPLVAQDNKVFLLTPRRQDWEDLPTYATQKLKFKRFKTLLIDYILQDTRLQNTGLILYLDVDIVVGKPLWPWMQQKWQADAAIRAAAPTNLSFAYMFDTGNGGKAAHSGVILLHTKLSRTCLDVWRQRMDEGRLQVSRDQHIIRLMRKAGPKKTGCRIPVWPRKELIFPMPKDFEQRTFAQFVHITNTFHAAQTDPLLQKEYLEDALMLTEEERAANDSLAIVPEGF